MPESVSAEQRDRRDGWQDRIASEVDSVLAKASTAYPGKVLSIYWLLFGPSEAWVDIHSSPTHAVKSRGTYYRDGRTVTVRDSARIASEAHIATRTQ